MTAWNEFCRLNNAPPRLANATLEVNQFMPQERADAGQRWLANPRKSLILSGDVGRGKTYFMWALMRGLISKMGILAARFFRSKNIDDRLLKEVREYGSAQHFLQTLKEIPFLFLDDFGVERSGERSEREYFEIIDDRVAWERPMIISTNMNDEEILACYGSRIHSRLKVCVGIDFEGPDLRSII